MNPWFSIWIRPRATIRHVVAHDPERLVWVLAMLAGIGRALDRADMRNAGDQLQWPFIALGALMVGPLLGVAGLYLGGALVRWTGRWLGGQGSAVAIRAAIAWAGALEVWGLLLWIPQVAVFGQELFMSDMPSLTAVPVLTLVALGFAVASVTVGLWTAVVLVVGLSEVQGFSLWRALANLLLAGLLIVAAVVVVAAPLRLLS